MHTVLRKQLIVFESCINRVCMCTYAVASRCWVMPFVLLYWQSFVETFKVNTFLLQIAGEVGIPTKKADVAETMMTTTITTGVLIT